MDSIGLRRAGTFTDYVTDGQVNSDGSYTIQLNDGRYYTLSVQDRSGKSTALDEKKWERATTLMLTMLEKKGLINCSKAAIGGTNVSAKGIKHGAGKAVKHNKGRAQTVREYQEFSSLVNGNRPGTSSRSGKIKKSKKNRRVSSHSRSLSRGRSPARSHSSDSSNNSSSPSNGPRRSRRSDSSYSSSPSNGPRRDQFSVMDAQMDALREDNARLQAQLQEVREEKDAFVAQQLQQQADQIKDQQELLGQLVSPEAKPGSGLNSPLNVSGNSNSGNASDSDVSNDPPRNPELKHALDTIQQQSSAMQDLFKNTLEQITAANDKRDQLLADRFAAQDALIGRLLPQQAPLANADFDSESEDESEIDDTPEMLIQSGAFGNPSHSPRTHNSDLSRILDAMQDQFRQTQDSNARLQEQLLQNNQRTQAFVEDLVRGNQDMANKLETKTPDVHDIIQGLGDVLVPQNKILDKHLDSNTQVIAALAEALSHQQPPGNPPGVGGGVPQAAIESVVEDKNVRALQEAILGLQKSNNNDEVLEVIARLEQKVNTSIPPQVVEMIGNQIDQLRRDYREQLQRFEIIERNHAEEQIRLNGHITELIKLLGQKDAEVKTKADDIQRIESEIIDLRSQIADQSQQAEATEALRRSMEENFRRLFELLGANGAPQNNQEAQAEIEALRREIDELKLREENANRNIAALEQQVNQKDDELRARNDLINRDVRELQERNEQMLERIRELESTNAAQFAELNAAKEEIKALKSDNQQLTLQVEQLLSQLNGDERTKAELEERLRKVTADSEAKDSTINKFTSERDDLQRQNAVLRQQIEQIEATLQARNAEIEALTQNNQGLHQRVEELLAQITSDEEAKANLIRAIDEIKRESELKNDIIEEARGQLGRLQNQNAELQEAVEKLEAILRERDAQINELIGQLEEANEHRGITPAEVAKMRKELIEMYSGSERIARACCKGQVRRRVFGKGASSLMVGAQNHKLTPQLEKAMWKAFGLDSQYDNVLREVLQEHALHKEIKAIHRKLEHTESTLLTLANFSESEQEARRLIDKIGSLRLDCAKALELPEDYARRDAQEANKDWFINYQKAAHLELKKAVNKIIADAHKCAGLAGGKSLFPLRPL